MANITTNKPNPGDKLKIVTKKEVLEGILMPSPNEKVIIVKLENGYNLGLEKKDILEMKVIGKKEDNKKQETTSKAEYKISFNPKLKTITILHCGGTIASKVDYETGAVKAKFSPEELLEMFPELGKIANIKSKLIANMLSENMRFAHYNIIAKEIEIAIKEKTDGIIITHGTDTLHYTAAALSFALENLSIPIILVGAQRSSDRGSSDAFLNLKCAAQFIANSDFSEVALCMHADANDEKCAIIPGTRARKMHSSRRDAFKAINAQPYAKIDGEGNIEWLKKDFHKTNEKPSGKLILKLFKENLKVGMLKAHPNMFAEEFKAYHKFDGLILEGTGLGHFPTEKYDSKTNEHELIIKEIAKLSKKIPVAMALQTIFGVVNMNVYSPGRRLIATGVLGNELDMTPETAFIKLAWLLSNYKAKQIAELYGQNLRGESSSQRNYEKDFLK